MPLPVGSFYFASENVEGTQWVSTYRWHATASLIRLIGLKDPYLNQVISVADMNVYQVSRGQLVQSGKFSEKLTDSEFVEALPFAPAAMLNMASVKALLQEHQPHLLVSSDTIFRRTENVDTDFSDIVFLTLATEEEMTEPEQQDAMLFREAGLNAPFSIPVVSVDAETHFALTTGVSQSLKPYLICDIPADRGDRNLRSYVVYKQDRDAEVEAIVSTFFNRGIIPSKIASFASRITSY